MAFVMMMTMTKVMMEAVRDVRGGAFSSGAGRGQKSAGRGEGKNPRGRAGQKNA